VAGRKYKLFIPHCDGGGEALVTDGYVFIEIADVFGNLLVRNQRRVSVETLVRALFPDDKLDMLRKLDGLDMKSSEAGRPHNTPRVSVESQRCTKGK
jgi:hypothetical protein